MHGMTGYDLGELIELAECKTDQTTARVASAAGGGTGVGLPNWVQPGQLLSPAKARQLAAQLLLSADLHDEIINQYVEGRTASDRVKS